MADTSGMDQDQSEATAQRLLCEILGDRSEQLQRQGHLDVHSSLFPSIVYRLHPQNPIEVYDSQASCKLARLCVAHAGQLPPADRLLAKALWLKADEAAFLKIARRID
ncbi:MAG: hypothetical protein ACYC1C_04725 [Chloroflexota bacterium]